MAKNAITIYHLNKKQNPAVLAGFIYIHAEPTTQLAFIYDNYSSSTNTDQVR